MSKYLISDECRHYLDAILPTFKSDRLADIRGSIKKIIQSENGDSSDLNILRLYFLIISFMEDYKFGHSVDYVFLIDEEGGNLKDKGSLAAYEEWENQQNNSKKSN